MEAAYRNFWPRLAGRLRWQSVTALNAIGSPVEWMLTSSLAGRAVQPLLFIIGPPRCGSTVLYQAMIHRFDVGYLSNTHALFYRLPSAIERAFHLTRFRPGGQYRSTLGTTRGWNAPSEAGRFWYRFYRRSTHEIQGRLTGNLSPARRQALLRSVRGFADACGRPVVWKNLFSTIRVHDLADLFPESRFIVMRRDELEIGRSLLAARWSRFGNYGTWFSVPPPNVASLTQLPPHQQVIEQSRALYRLIDQQRQQWGPGRFHEVEYRRLCDDPRSVLDSLHAELAARGVVLGRRGELPESFTRRESPSVAPDLYERMVDYADATR